LASEGLAALGVALAVAALGLPLGWLWATLAPHVQVVMTPNGPFHVDAEPEGYIGAEGWYVLIAFVVGLLTAVAIWLVVRSRRGPAVLAGLALGSVVAGVLMAWLGHRIGLANYERLLHTASVGTRFERPVDLRTKLVSPTRVQGAVLVQAIAAVAMYSLMTAFSNYPSLRRVSSDWSVLPAHPMAPAPPATAVGAQPPA
jgi:hypothetical protein